MQDFSKPNDLPPVSIMDKKPTKEIVMPSNEVCETNAHSTYNSVHELGYPFNPTSDDWNFDFPSNVRLTGVLKKNIRTCPNVTKKGVVDSFQYALNASKSKYSESGFAREDVVRAVDSIPNFTKERMRLFNISIHPASMVKYRKEMFGRPYSMFDKMSKFVLDLYERVLNSRGLQKCDVDDAYIKGILLNGSRRLRSGHFVICDLLVNQCDGAWGFTEKEVIKVANVVLSAAEEESFKHDVVVAIWGMSFIGDAPAAFAVFRDIYPGLITKEEFPFLWFSLLDEMMRKIKTFNDKLYDNDDYMLHFLVGKIMNDTENALRSETHPSEVLLYMRDLLTTVPVMPDVGYVVDAIDSIVEDVYFHYNAAAKTIASKDIKEPPKKISDLFPKVNELSCSDVVLSDLLALKQSASNTVDVFKDDGSLLEPTRDLKLFNDELSSIDDESKVLGAAPFENLDKINALFSRSKEIKAQIEESERKVCEVVDGALTDILEVYESSLLSITELLSEKTKSKDVVCKQKHLIVEGELSDALSREKDLTEQLEKLKSSQPARHSEPAKDDEPEKLSKMIKMALGEPTVKTVVDLLKGVHGDRLVISGKAKKSIAELSAFKNVERLFESLDKLSSKAFIDAYSTGGSAKAFSFFTKKELSFQESKGTKNKCNRNFKFPNKKTLDCRAHLRIGVDNTEQNQIRVYFAIENGTLYIGEITRHLPTQSKL